MIVADSNLIASCVLESTATESARNLLSADSEWYVPRLWRYEVTNILATMIKAKRLSAEMASSIFAALVESLKAYEREPMPDDVFALVSAVLASAVAGRIDLSRPKLNKKGNTKP